MTALPHVITRRGNFGFTNMPYVSDADLWPQAPIGATNLTSGGWFEPTRGENGDKCAWITPGTPGGAGNITTSTGKFAVQSLWGNNDNSGSGGCVIFHKDAGHQHQADQDVAH